MPNYKAEEKWDPWNGQHVSVTSTPTAGETANAVIGLAGLLIGNSQAKQGANAIQSQTYAWEAYNREDFKNALQLLQSPLAYWDDDDSMKGSQALILAQACMYEEAEAKAQVALHARRPSNQDQEGFNQRISYAHNALSIIGYWRGDFRGMLKSAGASINLCSDGVLGYCHRAIAWNNLGDAEQGLPDALKAVAIVPDGERSHSILGVTWFLLGNYDQAMKCFTRAFHLSNDKEKQAHYVAQRSHCYAKLGQYDQAWEDVVTCRDLAEYHADRLNAAAIVMQADNQIEEAKSALAMARVSKECEQIYKQYRTRSDELWGKGFTKAYQVADTEAPPERRGLAIVVPNVKTKDQQK